MLTNYHSDEDVFRAMKAGALAYILKTAPMESVIDAIRTVHAGERSIPPHIAQQLAQRALRNELSVREREILQLVAQGMKNKEIADISLIEIFLVQGRHFRLNSAAFGSRPSKSSEGRRNGGGRSLVRTGLCDQFPITGKNTGNLSTLVTLLQ